MPPIYLYQNPETEEVKEVVQGMNDSHEYFEDGIQWGRIFTAPNAAIDTKLDAFDRNKFIEKTGNMKGSVGDMMDLSEDLSREREESRGEDPVKRKLFDDYQKKTGKKHLKDKPKRIETNNVIIDVDN